MSTNARILNRDNGLPSDGWYHIEVTGTHPAGPSRKQVIDATALASIVNRFDADKKTAGDDFAGMLVDLDHQSRDLDKTTEAYAWLQAVEIRNGQLWGKLDLTDLGETAIRNKRVKFFSTEYAAEDLEILPDGNVRPLRLDGLAFTNRPNNRGGKPISNRADDPSGGQKNETETNTPIPMTSIAEMLGLPAEADEAAILNAITELQSKLAEAEAKTKEADDKANEAAADAVLNRYGSRIPEAARTGWKEQLIANRAGTEALLKTVYPPTSTTPIHNRSAVVSRDPVGAGNAAKEEVEAKAIRNRANELQKSSGGRRSWKECWDQAESEQSSRN